MTLTEAILFGLYVCVGPFAWAATAYFVWLSRRRMNKLAKNRDPLPADRPSVSVVIPAKDEGLRVGDCVHKVIQQDYRPIEVIAVNDRSTDTTGDALRMHETAAVAHWPRNEPGGSSNSSSWDVHPVRVIHVESLPDGWLGKCHAIDRGVRHARGEWLLFVDSDVRLEPNALSELMTLAVARNYDAVSILTAIETHTVVERLMLPLLAGTWMTMFAGDLTNEDSRPDKALANGQVFLIRRSAYDKAGGHAAVKDRIVEDVELMRLLKASGCKVRFLNGAHLASTRMHTSLNQMFNGWARIFAGTARGSVWPMLRMIGQLGVGYLSFAAAVTVAITFASWPWVLAATVHGGLVLGVCGCVWWWSGVVPFFALLLPISVPIEIAILAYAIRKAIGGKIDWRGSAVDVRQTSKIVPSPSTAGEG